MINLRNPVDWDFLLEELHPSQFTDSAFPCITGSIAPPSSALAHDVSDDDWGIYDYYGTPLYLMWNGHFYYDVQFHDGTAWHPVEITGFY